MIGLFRRLAWRRAAVADATEGAGARMEGNRGWRRFLTANNLFLASMVLVLAFLMARRQGVILDSPPMQVKAPGQRNGAAPEFVLADLGGNRVRLSDHRGHVVLLNFWATWCPPCRAEMPSMEKLYQAYRDRGLVILAISGDRTGQSTVEVFVQEVGVTFPILLDPANEVFAQYGVRGLPTSFLLDRQGRIVSAEAGARDWNSQLARQVVDALLKEE
ncbi:MAG TPA: TlpA disulfide reductase family protein [Candidatus Methylomirabilis sp.]|nr:TlpA disulfide reductase family protein [Candidatus Methylomirabilis sp.]